MTKKETISVISKDNHLASEYITDFLQSTHVKNYTY